MEHILKVQSPLSKNNTRKKSHIWLRISRRWSFKSTVKCSLKFKS